MKACICRGMDCTKQSEKAKISRFADHLISRVLQAPEALPEFLQEEFFPHGMPAGVQLCSDAKGRLHLVDAGSKGQQEKECAQNSDDGCSVLTHPAVSSRVHPRGAER